MAPRNVWLENISEQEQKEKISQCPLRILELMQNDLRNVDINCVHSLPHLCSVSPRAKNCILYAWETSHHRNSNWSSFVNRFDLCVTFSKSSAAAIRNSGISCKIAVVPHPIDTDKPNNPKLINILKSENKCVMTFIGEYSVRKNLEGLIRSYYVAFQNDEPVVLFLKTFVSGANEQEGQEFIKKDIERIKAGSKLKKFPEIMVSTTRLSPFQLDCLIKSSNYFVTATFGEAFCLGLYESLNFGVSFIAPNSGPFREYLNIKDRCGWLVETEADFCWDINNGMPDHYCANELWDRPNLPHLSQCMREAFKTWVNPTKYSELSSNAKKLAAKFSFIEVGKKFREVLEKI